MTKGALYLVVVSEQALQDDAAVAQVWSWLEAVQIHAPGSLFAVVWTQVDVGDLRDTAAKMDLGDSIEADGDDLWDMPAQELSGAGSGFFDAPSDASGEDLWDFPLEGGGGALESGRGGVGGAETGLGGLERGDLEGGCGGGRGRERATDDLEQQKRDVMETVTGFLCNKTREDEERVVELEGELAQTLFPDHALGRGDEWRAVRDRRDAMRRASNACIRAGMRYRHPSRGFTERMRRNPAEAENARECILRERETLAHGDFDEEETLMFGGFREPDSTPHFHFRRCLRHLGAAAQHELADLEEEMRRIESAAGVSEEGRELLSAVHRARVKARGGVRPLFCTGTSCRTGFGLDHLKSVLQEVVLDKEAFPSVGTQVPLNPKP